MLCQKCGVRQARTIITSCNGRECYELHLCLQCRNGINTFPTPDEQQKVVESAMEGARAVGLDEESVSDALGIDAEEIRRVLRGEGVSDPAVWQIIKSHLRMD
ncbi:MAG: hypothetical protein WAV28_06760 [Sedimentisphaerales bacterium]